MRFIRTLLFSPASRPGLFAKALASPADAVCVDLEDAVAPDAKDTARAAGIGFLAERSGPERVIRINALGTATGLRDVLAIVEARPPDGTILLPKVGNAAEVALLDALLSEAGLDLGIGVLVETAAGLENVADIARASPRITFMMFGGADLASELGTAIAHEPLLYARSRVVHGARLAGLQVIDMPAIDFRDDVAVQREAVAARGLGFTGKAVIHPANVVTVNRAFMPAPEEIAAAERILAANRANPAGAIAVDGRMVDRPIVAAAERVVALAATGRK